MSLFTFTCLPSKVSTKTADYLGRPQRILRSLKIQRKLGKACFLLIQQFTPKATLSNINRPTIVDSNLASPGGSTCELDETYASYLILAHLRHYAKT